MSNSERIEQLLAAMTLEEKVSILAGEDFWSVPAIERLNIGKLRVTDGPNGARGGGSLIGGVKSASFPVGIALGSTWNVPLLEEIGAVEAGTFTLLAGLSSADLPLSASVERKTSMVLEV